MVVICVYSSEFWQILKKEVVVQK
uniref:Uncharacterized protein n=1 Tax=Rhizophora mucronata TaxID=61149 RepID=A0A2P2QMX9_RHIMU